MESMIAASLTSPGSLTLDTRPIPALGEREVLLTVEATTLCGTDLRIMTGQKTNGVSPGVILGHEIAARVWRVGPGLRAGIDAPAPGTQVGLAPEISCGHCAPCTSGRSNVCANMALFGTGVDGGLAGVIRIPEHALPCITPTAREIAPPLLALAEPLSCCLRAHTRLPIESTSRVLVLGTGPIGLIHCALAAAAGASVMACGRPSRLSPALAVGASVATASQGENLVTEVLEWTQGRGADVVIIAVGDPGLVPIAAQCAAIGGHISCFAGFPAGTSAHIDPNLIHYRERYPGRLRGSRRHPLQRRARPQPAHHPRVPPDAGGASAGGRALTGRPQGRRAPLKPRRRSPSRGGRAGRQRSGSHPCRSRS